MMFLFYSWYVIFEIWKFSVQRIYSSFKVKEVMDILQGNFGLLFMKSYRYKSYRYFTYNVTLLCQCHICWMVWSPAKVTWLGDMTSHRVNRNECQTWVMNAHFFRNIWFHSLCRVHDFNHLYVHYIICQSEDYIYGLMTLVYLHGISLTLFIANFIIDFYLCWT